MAGLYDVQALAEDTAGKVSSSPLDWMAYLDTAAKLYRYPFSDSLLIHAQRPDATACASMELWNRKMNRWVNRGAKGIALIDDSGTRTRLRYVFDVSDTHMVHGGRPLYLWKMEERHQEAVLAYLSDTYGIKWEKDGEPMRAVLQDLAGRLADENLERAMDGLADAAGGTLLEGMGAADLRDNFGELLANSIFYMVSRRCGLEPMDYLLESDFAGITDFNTRTVLTFLGNAAGQIAESLLTGIGKTVHKVSRDEMQKNLANGKSVGYNNFNTLNRETEKQGGVEDGTDLLLQRGLPVSESDDKGRRDYDRQIRDAPQDVPERTQAGNVPEYAAGRDAGQTSGADRQGSGREAGNHDGRAAGEIPGARQGGESDGLGGAHEQPESNGGGEHLTGIGIQLSEEKTDTGLSEAEEEIASALSLPVFPTVEQQKREIEQRMQALYAGEIAISSDVVDEVLRRGGNKSRSHLRIIYNFMIDQTPQEYTEFIQKEYGTGGIGMEIGGTKYSVWHDGLGMQIAAGHTVSGNILEKVFLSWEDVSGRIHQLLKQGEYAPQPVLDAARSNALKEHASALACLEQDMADGISEIVFQDQDTFQGGFPDVEERLAGLLEQPGYLTETVECLEALAEAYADDPSIMRFQFYNPEKVLAQFQKFRKEAVPYQARDGFAWEGHGIFITQDEIDAFLQRGSAYSDGRLAIYAFFIQDKTQKEKEVFIKEMYGTGGSSHALSGADDSDAWYDGKGIRLRRGHYENPDAEILLKWPKVAERIAFLIENGSYLKPADYSRMPVYERQQMAGRVVAFYHNLPIDIMRPWQGNPDMSRHRDDVVSLLNSPDGQEGLLRHMDEALASLPLDYENYGQRTEILTDIHAYVEGTYTIFPDRKKQETIVSGVQMSIFDFMDAAAGEPETGTGTKKEPMPGNRVASETQKAPGSVTVPKTGETIKAETPTGLNPATGSGLETGRDEPGNAAPDTLPEEPDEAEYDRIESLLFSAMEMADVYLDDFSPEQVDIIYEAAEKNLDLVPMLNPEFPPEQMRLIAAMIGHMEADEQAASGNEAGLLTDHVMSLEEIDGVRKDRRLPQEPVAADEIVQADDAGVQLEWHSVESESPQPERENAGREKINFHITDDDLGAGGPKQKFRYNMDAILLLKKLESEKRLATPEEQEILSRFVGWGGIPSAFDDKNKGWAEEYTELKAALTPEEYREARASTLNAFYTSPTVIKAMYEALGNMGLNQGNVLEPSCGIGNFMGLVPESMDGLNMYGVELDSISGRIAKQLYQKNNISIQGFEKSDYPESFFDCVVGNVPFGAYKVADRKYDRFHFMIHDYFIAKSLDLVRPGGIVAVVTSSGTMDKQNPDARQYIANRADLLGAVRLPNNAFQRNAGTGVVADILFFQKRDRASLEQPDWVQLGTTPEGYTANYYFIQHPEMVLGEFTKENTQYGKQETTVKPIEGAVLSEQLREAVSHIHGSITETELGESVLGETAASIPADPSVKNFSFANVDGKVYYRENSRMNLVEMPAATAERVLGMVELRDITQELLQCQMEDGSDMEVAALQQELNTQYDRFTARHGLISSNANRRAFAQDSSYCLLASLELLDEEGKLERKADIFTKRTIRKPVPVTSVDTASEALAVSIGERAAVDVPFMAQLSGKTEDEVTEELAGVIFKNPLTEKWEASDEYLSGNVREKLAVARQFAEKHPEYGINVQFLERVQPKDLEASEIEVRLGATWIDESYITEFMAELFHTPERLLGKQISVTYAKVNGQWNISGKSTDTNGNSLVTSTYGTQRANAYRLLEDALNLRDTKIYDTVTEDGKEKRVLNKKETMIAQQKQEMIKEAFKEWVFRDIERREDLCRKYNDLFNSIRPREYDGSHIRFVGMTPEITLMQHQKNAVAHILYGNNTLLAHCVGAGKTFQMVAAGMESRRLGLSQKCLYVVPNHLTEQWGSDFLRLYPGANILVSTKKDFEPANRKKFCSRIATGSFDAVIIGHSQFERIPLSRERQAAMVERQISELTMAIEEAAEQEGTYYTVKQMEKTRKSLEARLERLNDQTRKDDVVTFEQLGVDRLFVDESHFYKNMFLYTKMQNIAGIAQTDAKKSSDMFMKCQYLDEITGGKGVTFATGTPVSNSMVELYTIMRYLQYDTLQKLGLGHFDSWAAAFGETVTGIELAPEGTGYRAKTRFARFFNLPELISLFKESADVQTADMLDLPVPEAEYVNEVLKPSEEQQELVSSFAERAERVRAGIVEPREDNMLKITNDGRKCALDQRLLNDMLPDAAESKVNRCVKNAFDIWKKTSADKATQLIFCDLSTPKNNGAFNVYDDVREKLVSMGIPREEVAFIHEAGTEAKKAELFAKVRSGQVRILLGSTPKLGAGTNIQDRLIALHHLDAPWKPSDLEQQEGRILRQGNRNKKVQIYRYVTENTFDAFMWQILENKQKFISQIMTSKAPVRSCEDVDDTALSYAEIKALATGNPYIREKMDLDIQVSRLKLLKANHTSQKYRLESEIAKNYPVQITALKERIAGLRSDAEAVRPLLEKDREGVQFSMTIGGKVYTDRKEAGTALIAACAGLKAVKTAGLIGEFHGFSLSASFDGINQKYLLTIKRQCSYQIEVGKDPLGNLQRISNALSGIEKKLEESKLKLETVQKQLATAKEEVEKPFAKEAELSEKMERLSELNALLNMDEKGTQEALGMDDGQEVAEHLRTSDNLAGKVAEYSRTEDEDGKQTGDIDTADMNGKLSGYSSRTDKQGKAPGCSNADKPAKKSVLGRLNEAKQRIAAGSGSRQKPGKKKGQEL